MNAAIAASIGIARHRWRPSHRCNEIAHTRLWPMRPSGQARQTVPQLRSDWPLASMGRWRVIELRKVLTRGFNSSQHRPGLRLDRLIHLLQALVMLLAMRIGESLRTLHKRRVQRHHRVHTDDL